MKHKSKLVIGGLVLGTIALSTSLKNGGETYNTNCETYQGYTDNGADGERIFVFDEQIRERRISDPNYELSGDTRMREDLKIGKEYRLEIMEPIWSAAFPKKLLSFENCDYNSE